MILALMQVQITVRSVYSHDRRMRSAFCRDGE